MYINIYPADRPVKKYTYIYYVLGSGLYEILRREEQ